MAPIPAPPLSIVSKSREVKILGNVTVRNISFKVFSMACCLDFVTWSYILFYLPHMYCNNVINIFSVSDPHLLLCGSGSWSHLFSIWSRIRIQNTVYWFSDLENSLHRYLISFEDFLPHFLQWLLYRGRPGPVGLQPAVAAGPTAEQ